MYIDIERATDADRETEQIRETVDWLTGLPSRFPTHRSAERLRRLFTKIDLGDVRMARRLLR